MATITSNLVTTNTTVASSSTILSTQAASMASGWTALSPQPSGLSLFLNTGGGSNFSITYCDQFVYDSVGKKFYFLTCDHGEVLSKMFIYDEASNAWSRISLPWGYTASNPTPYHGYHHTAWCPRNNKVYHRTYNGRVLRRWDSGDGSSAANWGTVDYSSSLFYGASANGIAYFPTLGSGRICVFQLENGIGYGNGGLISIDPITNAITVHASGSQTTLFPTADHHNFCLYSPNHDCLVFGGGNPVSGTMAGRQLWKMNSSGTITAFGALPSTLDTFVTGGGCIGPASDSITSPPAAHPFIHPTTGDLVIIRNANAWWSLNPTTGVWTDRSATTIPFMQSNLKDLTCAYGTAFCPVPSYGVAVAMKANNGACSMWLWKP